MNSRFATLCAGLALAALFAACRDAAVAPSKTDQRPSFATVSDTGPGGGPGQSHFISNSDFASASWFVPTSSATASDTGVGGGGFTFGFVNVSKGGSVTNPQAFLSYFIQRCTAFFSCSVLGGFGLIPPNDVSGGGKRLLLSTNTSGNPNFTTFGGPPGPIMVDWTANGAFTQFSSGTMDLTFPGFRQHTTGVSSSVSANATGTVVGIAMAPVSPGNIGSNQNVTIDIVH
jgi:hypothetical protein